MALHVHGHYDHFVTKHCYKTNKGSHLHTFACTAVHRAIYNVVTISSKKNDKNKENEGVIS